MPAGEGATSAGHTASPVPMRRADTAFFMKHTIVIMSTRVSWPFTTRKSLFVVQDFPDYPDPTVGGTPSGARAQYRMVGNRCVSMPRS
ncbi:hypothetical protein D3260_15665 [Salinisphaera sp. Q1T1-3]|nr:hypothetical protein D3260_15665 [Salinisphaera sp. Q1T1-3]